MELREVDKEEFNHNAQKFTCKNFFQTSNMGSSLELRGRKVYYLGLFDNTECVALAMLVESGTFLLKKTFEALKGFLIDYSDTDKVKIFTEKLLEFVRDKNGFKLNIDPYIIEVERDIDGNIVPDGKNNYSVIEALKNMGYQKCKYDTQVRFNFCLDVLGKSEQEIFGDFKATTRNLINKAERIGVEVIDLKYDELDRFKAITEDTCKRRGFSDKTLEYYQSMYKAFENQVVFKLARLNVTKYQEYLNKTKDEYLEKIDKITGSNKKKDNYLFEVSNIDKKLANIEKLPIKDGYVDLAAAMFMLYGDETIYLFSGSYDELNEFGGQYLIQWDVIKYAINKGYRRHNFFGIMNFQDKNDKDYGIYLFKRGFNGYIEELVGEYTIYTKGLVSSIYKLKSKVR